MTISPSTPGPLHFTWFAAIVTRMFGGSQTAVFPTPLPLTATSMLPLSMSD
jgi:hypothetical protein